MPSHSVCSQPVIWALDVTHSKLNVNFKNSLYQHSSNCLCFKNMVGLLYRSAKRFIVGSENCDDLQYLTFRPEIKLVVISKCKEWIFINFLYWILKIKVKMQLLRHTRINQLFRKVPKNILSYLDQPLMTVQPTVASISKSKLFNFFLIPD